jgi:glycosyltransferase involved in cell wall biosynthesis
LTPLPKQPLVSIITPSYNQAAFLEQTMRSVLEQDYPRVEYIVIDGASTDGSVDIIKRYAQRLAYWESKKDRGQAEAINKGMSRAKGEIVAWLNSDDYYLPHTIARAVQAFKDHPTASLLYADMQAVNEQGEIINALSYSQFSLEDLLCFHIIGQPAVFMRRDIFEKAGGLDIDFHLLLDHHLWIKIAMQGEILHVPQVWSAARYHSEAKNRALASEFGHEAFRILNWAASNKRLAPILARVDRRARASAYRVDARYLLDGGQPFAALRSWLRAFWFHPPVALARLNILASALLGTLGLQFIREWVLQRRKSRRRKN